LIFKILRRYWWQVILLFALTPFLILLIGNVLVVQYSKNLVYESITDIPSKQVGLVLGTSNRMVNGNTNLFFKYRVEAAADLFKQEKIQHIIVSGDNGDHSYNEPRKMYQALVKLGIPENCITLDFAGFRTLDSVVRCKEVFQQSDFTIVSQQFHNYRAAYIARYWGINAVAYNAKEVVSQTRRPYNREYLARVKALLDLHILKTKPKFLGEKINITI